MRDSRVADQPIALISVYDKTGLLEFAHNLCKSGFRLLSTGGTRKHLLEGGLDVRDICEYTGSPTILEGRVKTLHPKIHGGILFDPKLAENCPNFKQEAIEQISLVVVNFYPFVTQAVAKKLQIDEAIEFIDIGGPTMLRAAAKNHRNCLALCDPSDYPEFSTKLSQEGAFTSSERRAYAAKVFKLTSLYDQSISNYLEPEPEEKLTADSCEAFPEKLVLHYVKNRNLRYGENPQQRAALYVKDSRHAQDSLSSAKVLQGKELSYNNLLDVGAGLNIMADFSTQGAVCIIKHTNPCGASAGSDETPLELYQRALAGDPKSAFGGIVVTNLHIDAQVAQAMSETFLECVAAPGFSPEARKILGKKQNLRVLEFPLGPPGKGLHLHGTSDSLLIQDSNFASNHSSVSWQQAGKHGASEAVRRDLIFAFTLACHVKSNALVLAKNQASVGVGAGQMSRIDALDFALTKAQQQDAQTIEGSVLASDAFFPFSDCVDLAAKRGIAAIVQPGGSIRDRESIAAADQAGIPMYFSGVRHFKH